MNLLRVRFPVFFPAGERAEFYGEGIYNYQIVLTPIIAPGIKSELAEARRNGNSDEVSADLKNRGLLPESPVVSGSFRVLNGAIITAGAVEPVSENAAVNRAGKDAVKNVVKEAVGNIVDDPPMTDDQVIPDDLIVQGSICAGFDCVNNENFGFDTIRLKENNTRIAFADTSVGTFPANQWQLLANDSASGGANKFSIEDITGAKTPFTVTAGAPTNSFFVASNGKVGFRTSTPVLDIHINTADTPAFRFEQNNSGGFTAQTWDVAGNEANFFVRDLTGGSRLPFRIRPGAPTSSIDIAANGDVGMGTSAPAGPLDIKRGTDQLLLLASNGRLLVKNSFFLLAGGIRFPDGTFQTTAAVSPRGTNGTYLSSNFSTHLFGTNGIAVPGYSDDAKFDLNTNSIGVKDGGGNIVVRYNIAASQNLADPTASFVVYKIRYRDTDDAGSGARVRLTVRSNNIDTGTSSEDVIFNSDVEAAAGKGFTTVTVCRAASPSLFNFDTSGTWIDAEIKADSGSNADLAQIQIYKSVDCP